MVGTWHFEFGETNPPPARYRVWDDCLVAIVPSDRDQCLELRGSPIRIAFARHRLSDASCEILRDRMRWQERYVKSCLASDPVLRVDAGFGHHHRGAVRDHLVSQASSRSSIVSFRMRAANVSLSLGNCLIAYILSLLRQVSMEAIAYAGGAEKFPVLRTS